MPMNKGLSTKEVQSLLDELCTRLGYCLQPAHQATLRSNPPLNVSAFVDAVLVAEELKPEIVPKERRNQLLTVVSAAFARSSSR